MQDALQRYDAIVIGAGQAGGPLSTALAGSGRKTAIVEQDKVGGTCINFGCTPTKTMVASARVAYLARRAPDFGVHVGDVRVDMREVRARKQSVVESFRSSSERHLQNAKGLDLLRGRARFTGPHALEVRLQDGSTRQLEAQHQLLAAAEQCAWRGRPGQSNELYDRRADVEADLLQ